MAPTTPGEAAAPAPLRAALVVHPERLTGSPWPFPPQKRIGGLPLLKRLLLTLHRAGVRRFLLVGYPLTPDLERLLQEDSRLAGVVEVRDDSSAQSLGEMVAGLARELGTPFLWASGNQVFSPSVAERLWEQADTGGAVGPAVVRLAPPEGGESAILAYVRKPVSAGTGKPAIDWLSELQSAGQVELLPPPDEGYWQALSSPAAWAEAERKINRSLYKPTDNLLARLNRKVSIPISRVLVPRGVSPNAVTLVTLLLSFASGVAFARGEYAWTVLGGFLTWFTSMLDGSDGEVARLTYTESDFGCWLEATCDHLFYIIVFAGIAFGLYRLTADPVYLYTGGLFEFGAVVSFWVLAHQRKTTTQPGAASTYVVRWRQRLEAHKSNLFYRIALRYGELTRRSTLPYVILFFSLLGDLNFLLFMGTFGANLVWILSLYSNRVLRGSVAAPSETD